jgi:fructokinase
MPLGDCSPIARSSLGLCLNSAGCALGVEEVPKTLAAEIDAIHCGSFSLGVESFGSALEMLCHREADGRVISVDPNIRAFLIDDRFVYEERLGRFHSAADVMKVSDEDLAWMHPGMEAATFAQTRLDQGAALVVVTLGAEGALAFSERSEVLVKAETVSLVDTVGAGDTFQAALLAGLSERGRLNKKMIRNIDQMDLERLVKFAIGAAGLIVPGKGVIRLFGRKSALCEQRWCELPPTEVNECLL